MADRCEEVFSVFREFTFLGFFKVFILGFFGVDFWRFSAVFESGRSGRGHVPVESCCKTRIKLVFFDVVEVVVVLLKENILGIKLTTY